LIAFGAQVQKEYRANDSRGALWLPLKGRNGVRDTGIEIVSGEGGGAIVSR